MEKIVSYIIDELGEEFSRIRLSKCQLFSRIKKIAFEFILPSDVYEKLYNSECEEKIINCLKLNCGPSYSVEVQVKKTYSDVHIIRNNIYNFMSEKYPIAAAEMTPKNFAIEGNSPEYYVELKLPSHIYTYLSSANFVEELRKCLEVEFCDTFNLILTEDKSMNSASNIVDVAPTHERIFNPLTVEVTVVRALIGSEVRQLPRQIKTLKGETQTVICGRVSMIKKNTAKTSGKLYYKFTLSDPTGSVEVLYFPRGKNPEQFDVLVNEGDEILVTCDVKEGEYGKSVFLRDITKCVIDWNSVEGVRFKPIPKFYTYVEPVPFEIIEQDNMFEERHVCEYLKGKTFVIFDFETTGLDTNTCEVIELGALKMVDGIVVEEFSTFAKPSAPIDEEVTKLTSITQEMVENSPSFSQILPDFLRFCEGATLVAHNQEYDVTILLRYCKEEGYKFENPTQCTLALSRKYLPGLKNHKLEKVAEHYGYVNQQAHRAIGDVDVTAKIFVKLAENLE